MKRFFCLILALVLVLAITPAALAYDSPAATCNKDAQWYANAYRFATPVTSHLAYEDGGYLRVECFGDHLIVERFDAEFNFISGQSIDLELPLYGGVYIDDDYNFVVVGQTNYEENDETEVFRIIRYTKDWEKVDHASIYGANTTIPFDAGSLRFDRSGDILYIRTSHEMYASEDDCLNHQANVMIALRISDMTVTDQLTKVWNNNYGYVSHSFNQFVRVDGSTLLAVDHGDAYPRSVCMFKYGKSAGSETFYSRTTMVNVLNIVDSTYHYNDTGVSVGGFECSSDHYLVAGSSYDQTESIDLMYAHRNIFVTATPKDDFTDEATTIRWLTHYSAQDNVKVSPPHLLKLGSDSFFLTWTEGRDLMYCFLDGSGNLDGEVYTSSHVGALSDCPPILVGDKIVWYVTDYSAPTFYVIDRNNPGDISVPHDHKLSYSVYTKPTHSAPGLLKGICPYCDETDEVVLPVLSFEDYSVEWITYVTCTSDGYGIYVWDNTDYGRVAIESVIPAPGHNYQSVVTDPTCEERGYTTHTCSVCKYSYTDSYTNALGHDWEGLTCQRCGEVNMPFTDVKPGKYYYEPVIWAVENGITTGTTATTFEPNKACTRAQVVTFLWRAAGCPEPTSTGHNFTDISSGKYYYDAVLWAVENGITTGTSATRFSPNDPCSRAHIVTFLWRFAGCPNSTVTEHDFTDVPANKFYFKAVLWAVEEGITTGTTATKFSPNDPCTRGQVVTFLWRAKPEEVTPEEPQPDNPPPADAELIHVTETIERTVKLTTMNGQTYWRFDVNLYNPTDKTVSLKKIITQNLSGGIDQGAPYVHEVAGSHLETMFDLVASPGETINWVDDHPVTYTFNGRRYTLELEDSEGNTYTKTYVLTYSYEGYHNPDAENAPGFGETGELTAYVRPGDRWDYTLWFRNNTDKTLCLKRMECEDYNDGTLRGPKWVHELPVLQDFFIPKYLAPGQVGNFQDGHPYVEDMDTRIYSFVYEDADGTEYTAATKLTLSSSQIHPELDTIYPDFSGDNGKDAFTLRHNADFAVEVGDGVYWVPANALGKSDYTNAQIQAMVTCTPEEKQARIDTLHEALQLYQIGGFYGSDDNVYIQENGLQWEHHKPGYHAVRTNHGCCATSANWLHYILDGDYEEIGYYSYYGVGGGHVFNYIKQGDWYYFADLTTWPAGNINVNAVESGDLNDFYNSDPIGGNILRAASLEAFADYILENHANPPGLIYTYLADDVTAKATEWYMDGSQALVMPDTDKVTIQYDDPDDSVTWRYNPAPVRNKDWTRDEDFLFDQMQFQ